MYKRFAAVYDAIYKFKNYAEEADALYSIAERHGVERRSLLDVACGTGEHILHLKSRFDCRGVDLSEELLEVAKEKNPGVEFFRGDMRTFDLDKQFDVVTCLFGAIGYMTDPGELKKACANLAKHTAPNGILIVEPWLDKENFKEGYCTIMTAETDTMKIARANTTKRDADCSVIEFHFLVADANGTEHFSETHRMGLFGKEDYLNALQACGLEVEHDEKGLIGRGLFIARRS